MFGKRKTIMPIVLIVGIMSLYACSGQTIPPEDTDIYDDNLDDNEWLVIAEEEVLFDFFSTPADWPREVPAVMNEFRVTRYERCETGMTAAGFGNLQISRANNFYMNARRESGTSFDWTFDPDRMSVTRGQEQVFYYFNDQGSSLTIILKEIYDDKIIFKLDYKE